MNSNMFDIVRSLVESDRSTDFVAIGNTLNDTTSEHAGFIIKFNNEYFEFHYNGSSIEFDDLTHDFYHKITDTIQPDDVAAFIAHCKSVKRTANPKYGYFYSGEYYDRNGIHYSKSDLGERMTCVGFCLNILKGYHEEDYIQYTDWNSNSHNNPKYLEDFCIKFGLDINKISLSHRRITPRECLISAFFTDMPITKMQIDSLKASVQSLFEIRAS